MKKHLILLNLIVLTLTSGLAQEISIKDLWTKYAFSAKSVKSFNSMEDGEHFTRLERVNTTDAIVKYSFKSGLAVDTLLMSKKINLSEFDEYIFSADEQKIIIKTNLTPIYRHSSTSIVYVYDVQTKKLMPIANGNQIGLPRFNPQGTKIAYTKENNLYYTDLKSEKQIQITTDGEKNKIINGAPDWVYEEEFAFDQAYEWSGNGTYIVYFKFDESNVKEFTMDLYDGVHIQALTDLNIQKLGKKMEKEAFTATCLLPKKLRTFI